MRRLIITGLIIVSIGCGGRVRTPAGWKIERTGDRPCCNPFGMTNPKLKQIKLMPPLWSPQKVSEGWILDHELAHAWGLKGCRKMRCLMYEPAAAGHKANNIIYEFLAKPLQVLYGFRFCPECRKYLKDKGALF